MAREINLLPQDVKPKVSVLKLSKKIRRFLILGFLLFVFLASTISGIFFVLSGNIKKGLAQQSDLKNQIKTYEESETKLVLISDRLQKISQLRGFDNAKSEVDSLGKILSEVNGTNVIFSDASLKTDVVTVGVNIDNSETLANFLYALYAKTEFKRINLMSLNYSTDKGFKVEFSVIQ